VLRFEAGDTDGAIEDLGAALEVSDDPTVRENRAVAYAARGLLGEAVADSELALAHPGADRDSLAVLLQQCQDQLAAV
jgi:hypothetical protein